MARKQSAKAAFKRTAMDPEAFEIGPSVVTVIGGGIDALPGDVLEMTDPDGAKEPVLVLGVSPDGKTLHVRGLTRRERAEPRPPG